MASVGTTKDSGIAEAEAAAVGNAKKSRRRISDYLAGDNSDGGEASAPSPPETPPQLRLPRFTCARFRFVGRLGRKRHGSAHTTEDDASLDSSTAGALADRSSNSPAIAGSKPSDAEISTSGSSANASAEAAGGGAMGLSVLLLLALARTWVELNRMTEVRARMEALLKEVRDEAGRVKETAARRRHASVVVAPRTLDPRLSMTSTSTSTVSASSCTSETDTNRRHHDTTTAKGIARHGCESEPAEDAGAVEMEAAAEFFEAEHAPHRATRTNCNAEQGNSESSDDDEFIELDGVRFGGTGNLIKWDGTGDEDSEEKSTGVQGGVSAAELERRLHELLHRRNEERIEELERALRRAEQRLREKEMEARLWQDTATLALQPPRHHHHRRTSSD